MQPNQSCRFIEITNEWFFFTREKELLGPYRSRRIVEHAAKLYGKKKRAESNTHSITNLFGGNKEEPLPETSNLQENVLDFEHPNWDL